ncbi:glycerol-3-phosphate dehydrogenase/oxidase [Texcoconibacillus texcoconensis]|uniref:Glycerol-3-phosphate dehydrogenase n=1 Tax=Texcoconibacillus texcoconensis TaxID=1095777 RepID=A0A840QPL7_9BACI|nr:glycerol-3-phosphate dehydrogenase/oxidase [Texcoconibacillus texcoconensis]MBB5173315.1 glycerol-3-phosphate dehydrogenase [Texcoconibacillus texcoconensis]
MVDIHERKAEDIVSKSFSSFQRQTYLEQLQLAELDLLVIGGGITGAGIALDATVRGLRVGVVEMQDFAAGTSSRSTKLVHGGLRYLKQLDFKLVSEVGKERAIVYENAPHVTKPEWMLLPLTKEGTFGKFSMSIGLKLYDILARVRRSEQRKMLGRHETMKMEPLMRSDGLKGGGLYVEYKTDDARLTLETIKEAVHRGAIAVNYSKGEHFIYEHGKVAGVHVTDLINEKSYTIRAKNIVNATGPWVDTLREKDRSKKEKFLYHTKGVHLVVDQSKFPLQQAVYFDTKYDGRMMFSIPRGDKTYIGTTDTIYNGELAKPKVTKSDCMYILESVNTMFPTIHLTDQDIESCWAGIRPLIYEDGKTTSDISRKDELFTSESGLISIAGGKLTGYRKMAERTVDIVTKNLGIEEKCTTEAVPLSGGDLGGSEHFSSFIEEKVSEGKSIGLTAKEANDLANLYGTNVTRVYEITKTSGANAERFHLPKFVYASLVYSIEEEMVVHPLDFFNRRTGALYFDIDFVYKWKQATIDYMSSYFQWTESFEKKVTNELDEVLDSLVEMASRKDVDNTPPLS